MKDITREQTLRNQALRIFLKRKCTKQPHGKCQCGRTISGNKSACSHCSQPPTTPSGLPQ